MLLLTLSMMLAPAPASTASDWPQFRGPNGLAVSADKGLPVTWSKTDGHRWKVDLPARGVSSPIIVNGIVYITCSSGNRDDRLHILAYNAKTGDKLWQRQFAATGSTLCHPMSCMAAPTPVADETGVYALFATGDIACINADGSLRWYRSLVGDYPTICNQVGMASSPLLADGKFIVPMDNAGDSFLAALDLKTGKNLWKTPRPRDNNWVSPVLRPTGATPEILFPTVSELVAYDAATGKKLWSHPSRGGQIPSPSVVENTLYMPSGGTSAMKYEAGKLSNVWTAAKLSGGMSSPLVYEGAVYAVNTAGVMNAVDRSTGKALWNERASGKCSASAIAGDGKIYAFDEKGKTTVFKAGPVAEVLSTNDLGEEILGTPAISNGAIYIRTNKALYCIGSK
ncbi:PQQ-binding-like beta-propeller repeat protein [soil metagenome]